MCNRLKKLRSFLRNHRNVVHDYQLRSLGPALALAYVDRIDAIEWIFLNAIGAAGGSVPLESKRISAKEFRQRLQPLREQSEIEFVEVARAISDSTEESTDYISQIRAALRSGVKQENKFPHVGTKKADLFLRDLLLHVGRDIFGDVNLAPFIGSLRPPVDVVHEIVYCIFHGQDKANVTHDHIQEWARMLFPCKPVNADDIWFWGHFAIRRRTDKSKRKFARMIWGQANTAMVETDPHLACAGAETRNRVARLAARFSTLVIPREKDASELSL